MPSKRNPIASEPPGHSTSRTHVRPSPAPRASHGAAVITAPRKSELHRVTTTHRPRPTREQIALRAYEIWLQTGCVSGRDSENWIQAERELSAGCDPDWSAGQSAQQG